MFKNSYFRKSASSKGFCNEMRKKSYAVEKDFQSSALQLQ